jgi:hypothetical protein
MPTQTKLETTARCVESKLRTNSRSQVEQFTKLHEGKVLKVTYQVLNQRSNNQNAYYWGVLVNEVHARLVELGHEISLNGTHALLKDRFCYREHVLTDTGEVLKEPLSTSDLSKQEFNEYIDKIIRFAAEVLDIQIKYPNEQTEMYYEEPTNN